MGSGPGGADPSQGDRPATTGSDVAPPLVRFGTFELDLSTGELTRHGRRIPLQDQPARVLCLLVERAGQLVSREELRRALWSDDTFVEFETALNIAVAKVRQAVGDSATSPRFIETIPKRGYRFLADAHRAAPLSPSTMSSAETPGQGLAVSVSRQVPTPGRQRVVWRMTAGALLVLVGALVIFQLVQSRRGAMASTAAPRSLAVLPFKPLMAAEGDERLQIGMTEALIHRLSRIAALRVEPLARVRRYSGLEQDPLEAGRALGVDAVLEGHFQIANGRVHVRSRLLRTSDGTALAVDDWNEPFADIPDVQNRAAQSVASALELTLTPAERARIRTPDTPNAEAFRHYLFGRHHMEHRSYKQMLEAEREFRAALHLDPQYARAHAALALALIFMPALDGRQGIDVMGPAKDAALKAIALDGTVALAHTALACVYEWFEYDPVRAQREHLRAMELDDQDQWVLRLYSAFLRNRDAFDEALEVNRRDLELDPRSPFSNRLKAQILYVARRYDECVAQAHRMLPLDPQNAALSYDWLARCLEQQGKHGDYVDAWEQGRALRGNTELAERMKGIYAARGWEGYWNERLRMAPPHLSDLRFDPWAAVRLGRFDEAIRGLERVSELRNPVISWTNSPEWDPLRSDPRFQALRHRAGLSEKMNAALKIQRAQQLN